MGLFDFNIRPTLKACMLGPRAVGKTTVLTSIFAETKEQLAGSQLYIRPCAEHPSTARLEGYRTLLENAIENNNPAALPASMDETDFKFEIGTVGNPRANVDLLIKDYPGEYLTDSINKANVEEFLEESDIIMIAIDSPYLMEGKQFNDMKNKPATIKQFLRGAGNKLNDKLILFIPLKCERYFHDGKIDELVQLVKNKYDDMKSFFVEHNVASYIVSIQTLGGVEFDKMIPNPQPIDITHISQFRMYEKKPEYAPLFCAQPLFYLLTYIAYYTQWRKTRKMSVLDKMKDLVASYLRKDTKFFNEILTLKSKILINRAGCEVFTNNYIIKL